MAKIKDFIDIMEEFAPSNFVAPEFLDNVGLLIGCPSWQAGTVYCCLDVTNQAIDEAIKHKASLIISHHPPIFKPINKITTCDVLGQKIIKLIQNGIGLYTSHTNLDFVKGGINEFVAKQIGLTDLKPLNAYIGEDEGWGRMGVLPAQTDCDSFCSHLKNIFDDSRVRYFGKNKKLKSVAIVNGGGGDIKYIDIAKKMGADCFISGDIKHHVGIYSKDIDFVTFEVGHYATEHIYLNQLVKILKEKSTKANINAKIIFGKE